MSSVRFLEILVAEIQTKGIVDPTTERRSDRKKTSRREKRRGGKDMYRKWKYIISFSLDIVKFCRTKGVFSSADRADAIREGNTAFFDAIAAERTEREYKERKRDKRRERRRKQKGIFSFSPKIFVIVTFIVTIFLLVVF